MSAPAVVSPVDPVGLGGERISHTANGEHVTEMWVYSSRYTIESIRRGWLDAYPRARHFTSVEPHSVSAGRRFVKIEMYVRAPNKPLHIEEPTV